MQARGAKAGGNILDLVALLERCSVRDAALRLQDWSGTILPRRQVPMEDTTTAVPNAPLRFRLQHVEPRHPYLAGRGLAAETIRTFGVGFYRGSGFLRSRIVIPIHDEHGALIAYAGRAMAANRSNRFPTGFRKSLVLFNLHRVLKTGARTVVVVEGFFDALAIHQAGYPAVVALMGSPLSRQQANLVCVEPYCPFVRAGHQPVPKHGRTNRWCSIVRAAVGRRSITSADDY